jgi:NAD-dependent deacetylase
MSQLPLQEIATLLNRSARIVVLTGAGMSTESGIPDFRSANGLWTQNMSLADAISIDYFRRDPLGFWQCFKDIFSIKLAGNYLPNAGHDFLAWLEQRQQSVTILTQNIDGLHQRAGSRDVLELHGSLLTAGCPSCGTTHGLDYISQHELPLCSMCGDVLKPDVVLYGESVPHIEKAFSLAAAADCLLVMGSSLEVSPVNMIPAIAVENNIPAILINLSETRMDRLFDLLVHEKIGTSCSRLKESMQN